MATMNAAGHQLVNRPTSTVMTTEPVMVPTSGMSENRKAMNASSAEYSIGPMKNPSTVRKMNVNTPFARPSNTWPTT